ncbi:hypothetical protein D3C80_1151750 [compost metagenome]
MRVSLYAFRTTGGKDVDCITHAHAQVDLTDINILLPVSEDQSDVVSRFKTLKGLRIHGVGNQKSYAILVEVWFFGNTERGLGLKFSGGDGFPYLTDRETAHFHSF